MDVARSSTTSVNQVLYPNPDWGSPKCNVPLGHIPLRIHHIWFAILLTKYRNTKFFHIFDFALHLIKYEIIKYLIKPAVRLDHSVAMEASRLFHIRS